MASFQSILLFFLINLLAFSRIETSAIPLLKGSVTCLDCDGNYDFSGIKVLAKCTNVKKLAMATTKKEGSFETELPNDTPNASHANSPMCLAKVLGGPNLLYATTKNTQSNIVKAHGKDSYTLLEPLTFYKSCPPKKYANCAIIDLAFGSSKTVDVPLPKEWGFPPTSYYSPLVPIIGIP